jgi:hypothetical protein
MSAERIVLVYFEHFSLNTDAIALDVPKNADGGAYQARSHT